MRSFTSLLRKTSALRFSTDRDIQVESLDNVLDSHNRQLLESAKFRPVYQLTPEARNRVISSIYTKIAVGFVPTLAYLAYYITYLPFSWFYLSGFIITERMGMTLGYKIIVNHKRTVEQIEVCDEYDALRFKLLDVGGITSSVHTQTPLFNDANGYTFTVSRSNVTAINGLIADEFQLPSKSKDTRNVVTFAICDFKTVDDVIADLNCNALEQYNGYLKSLEAKNTEAHMEMADIFQSLNDMIDDSLHQVDDINDKERKAIKEEY